MSVAVLGSLNLDLFFDTSHFVRPGETLKPLRQSTSPGGKGLNQAIACARAGAETIMGGAVGPDGDLLKRVLHQNQVKTSFIKTDPEILSGKAVIQRCHGENCILLDAGANALIDEAYIKDFLNETANAKILLLQNEIPRPDLILQLASGQNRKIILNPAPMSEEILNCPLEGVDCLIVNETECRELFGDKIDLVEIMHKWIQSHPESSIIITLGSKGAIFQKGDLRLYMPVYPAHCADSTGAGDTFTGFIAAGLDAGLTDEKMIQQAAAAAALSIAKEGAACAVPDADSVKKLMDQHPDIQPAQF